MRCNNPMSTTSDTGEVLKPTVERRALRASGLALAILSFQTLGIVYSFLLSPFDP